VGFVVATAASCRLEDGPLEPCVPAPLCNCNDTDPAYSASVSDVDIAVDRAAT
jgi:hypothetical protein